MPAELWADYGTDAVRRASMFGQDPDVGLTIFIEFNVVYER